MRTAVRARTNKEEAMNKMATTGARMLSVEEASRYAGGFDDPARLVSAFAGYDLIKKAYVHAIAEKYRFFSYGDAMLLKCISRKNG